MRRAMAQARGLCALAAFALAGAVALGSPTAGSAASFPDHPIKLIVPFGPGGPPDAAVRIIGAYLSEHLGSVVVENHVGAGGTPGANIVFVPYKAASQAIGLGGEPEPESVANFAAFIVSQYKRWGDVLRITGVTLN